MLARAHKKFQRGRHSEIYLLTLKKQDKTKMELPLDMVSISASIASCRTRCRVTVNTLVSLSINIEKLSQIKQIQTARVSVLLGSRYATRTLRK